MLDTVDDVLASDINWMIVRVGLEDSLTDTLVGGAGWQSLGMARVSVKGGELVPGKHRTTYRIYTHTPALPLPSAARSQAPSGRKMNSILPNSMVQLEDRKAATELPPHHTSPSKQRHK